MLKSKFSRFFLLFGVILFLFVFVGCNHVDEGTLNNEDNSKKEETLGNEEEGNTELSTDPEQNTQESDGDSEIIAEPYIQAPNLSWVYSLEIKAEDGKIYVSGTLYEQVPSSDAPAVLFGDSLIAHANILDNLNCNQEFSSTLEKIKECETCYVLATNQVCKTGEKIIVYEIENAYYFVRCFDSGEVMRIHRAIIQ